MTTREFAYWLQGFFELGESHKMTDRQLEVVSDHLALVFTLGVPPHSAASTESELFAYWLRDQLVSGNHTYLVLGMVTKLKDIFVHEIDPSYTNDPELQAKMNATHDGTYHVKYNPDGSVESLADAPPSLVLVGPKPDVPAWMRPPGPNGERMRC